MGQIYERLGRLEEADACFSRAAGLGDAPWDAERIDPVIRADALRRLALHRRRQRRHDEAAAAWRALLDSGAAARTTSRKPAGRSPSTTSTARAISTPPGALPSTRWRPSTTRPRPTPCATGWRAWTASSTRTDDG